MLVAGEDEGLAVELAQQGIACTRLTSAAALEAALADSDHFGIVFVDGEASPGLSREICASAQARGDDRPYVVLVTRAGDGALVEAALAAGADDHLSRPIERAALLGRLQVGDAVAALRRRLSSVRSHLRFLATHDALTGTWNKSAILGCLYREAARAARERGALAVLMCDVDHFKAVNDRHGHPAGDELLRRIAGRVQAVVRPYDPVGRYGGEEFLVLLPGCGAGEARDTAERIVERIRSEPFEVGVGELRATLSIGVATLGDVVRAGDELPSPNRILELADAALYRAKELGRDRVVVASPARCA